MLLLGPTAKKHKSFVFLSAKSIFGFEKRSQFLSIYGLKLDPGIFYSKCLGVPSEWVSSLTPHDISRGGFYEGVSASGFTPFLRVQRRSSVRR